MFSSRAHRAAAIVAGVAGFAAPAAGAEVPAGLRAPVAYLERAQNPDGGFGAAPGSASSRLFGDWAVIALAAAGRDPREVHTSQGRSAAQAASDNAALARTPGDAERSALALGAAGLPVPAALVTTIVRARRRDGSTSGLLNLTSFGVLALRAAGRPRSSPAVRDAVAWILDRQAPDGSFSASGRRGSGGVDDTAAAIEALVAGGRSRGDRAVARAATFLAGRQRPDGGFAATAGAASNAQSTAWAIQGLVAAGRDPGRFRRRGSRTPIAYLRSLIDVSGAVRYSRSGTQTPVWVTAQAVAALARRPLPVRPVGVAR